MSAGHDAAQAMDDIYRVQRHFYDATRKYYLLGRDRAIAALQPPPGAAVLEIGCGTGRNLIAAARLYRNVEFFGLDVSEAMLETAQNHVLRAGLADRIHLRQGDAAQFVPQELFGREKFERIFISYALSMIPPWQAVLEQAARHLASGGALHVADFGAQERLPRWFCVLLNAWLARFSVSPRKDLAGFAAALAEREGLACHVDHLLRGYAIHVALLRPSGPA